MPIDDRIIYFVGGCILGFFLGYVVRTLRETKEELDEVKDIVKGEGSVKRHKDERGELDTSYILRTWKNWALLFVVALSVFASFKSQDVSNDVVRTQELQAETQRQLDRVVGCNQEVLQKALDVLNQRSTFTQGAATSNLDLQKAQKAMFDILLHIPPYSEERQDRAVREYNESLNNFVKSATSSQINAEIAKYPKAEELTACVRSVTKDEQE